MKRQIKLAPWQFDIDSLHTDQVQFWSRSGCMMGVRDLSLAQDCVKRGTHFVMCGQAVGEFDSEKMIRA